MNLVREIVGGSKKVKRLASSGQCLPDAHIVIAHPDTLAQCQSDEVGEIWIAGPSVARGYWKRPEETERTFCAYLADTGKGPFLRTGDLGFLYQGELFVTGRLKDLIIIRGRNHYPQDLEQTVAQSHPSLRKDSGAAFSIELNGEEKLVVVHEVERHSSPDDFERAIAAIRRAIAERHELQVYAIALIRAGSIPKTSSGKIQRHICKAKFLLGDLEQVVGSVLTLPSVVDELDLVLTGPQMLPQEPVARMSFVEHYLRKLVAKTLHMPLLHVKSLQSPVSLGIDSLMAIELQHDIETFLGFAISVADLLQNMSIADIASHILANAHVEPLLVPRPLQAVLRPSQFPLSFAQQRLWFIDQLEPGNPAYNVPAAIRLQGRLDERALERSLNEVVRRHEILRTTFVQVEQQPVQVIAPFLNIALPLVDLRGLDAAQQSVVAERVSYQEGQQPFQLERGPLLRVSLLRLQEQEHILLLSMHHIVSDGWSMGVLARELSALYAAFVVGEPSPLPDLPLQYADFALWQRQWLQGAVLDRQLAYWKQHLTGAPVLQLPTDYPRPSIQRFCGAVHPFHISTPLTVALRTLSRQEGVTLFMTLLAAFQILLVRYTGQEDIVVGVPLANRTHPEIEPLIGFFVNTLALRADLSGNPGIRKVLRRVRETLLEAYAHQDLPFEQIVEAVQPERSLSYHPLFQVAFASQEAPLMDMSLSGLNLELFEFEDATTRFDLELYVRDTPDGIKGVLQYNTDLFSPATITRMLSHFLTVLTSIVADPEQPVATVTLLTETERDQIIHEWNATDKKFPREHYIHQMFEEQAERFPDKLAVIDSSLSLTYHELDRRANQLAHHLQDIGMVGGSPVAIYMDRSAYMIIALLGVLKAGGMYIPLDIDWPVERCLWIFSSLQSNVVITCSQHLKTLQEVQWKYPDLVHIISLDTTTPKPTYQSFDAAALQSFWDHVAERSVDRVTAAGFINSYTGEPFTESEVDAYRDHVIALAQPYVDSTHKVLEIGCGSGLIMFELARQVQHYIGLDPSPLTQERNRMYAQLQDYHQIELLTGFAHELATLANNSFDLVIIASVTQFFPDTLYLEQVIAIVMGLLKPGGAIIIADVLDVRQKEQFKQSLLEFTNQHQDLRGKTKQNVDGSLYIDELFFRRLMVTQPQLNKGEILYRQHLFENELRYRYDVLFEKLPLSRVSAEKQKLPISESRLWTGWHLNRCASDAPKTQITPEYIAYIIYTSGSTGHPKGVEVCHRAIVNLIDWVNTTFFIGLDDRVLFVTSLCFDLSVYDIFGLLAAGGSIQVASRDDIRDPQRLCFLLNQEPITFWDSAPATLQRLIPFFSPSLSDFKTSHLRLVFLSGDWIPLTLPRALYDPFPLVQVIGLGGATEAAVWSNYYSIQAFDPAWVSIPYGKPIQNSHYHILDEYLNPCPIAIPGNLYIGGECLATGYVDPVQTSERFIPHPFGTIPGQRLYKTGDRARYWPDGTIEFLGRLDKQIKIRGFRIELGEIEATLQRNTAVHACIVLAREDVLGNKQLIAYIVPKEGILCSRDELRSFLQEHIPLYMLPADYIMLDAFPLSKNGKIDRRALPAPDYSQISDLYTSPRNATEEIIASIWAEILSLPQIGVSDNFFERGGHSLLATQVISRVREAFQIELALRSLFADPTVAGLAQAVQAARQMDQEPIPLLQPMARPQRLPLSFAQQRLWFLDQLEPGSPAYNVPAAIRLQGRLDEQALERSLNEVVRRHEILRTTFVQVEQQPVQVIIPFLNIALPLVDLRGLDAAQQSVVAERVSYQEGQQPFQLERGPLLRVSLLRLQEQEHILLLNMHHIVSDGWSMGVLARELNALYAAFVAGEPSPLPDLPLQYADFALWQRQWLQGAVLDRQLAYWKQHLAEASVLQLSIDHPRSAAHSAHGARKIQRLPESLTESLRQLSRREEVTLFITFLAAFVILLHYETGQNDILVGTDVANRTHTSIEPLIGFFVNQLVLRTDLSNNPTFRMFLAQVRDVTMEAYAHQEIPFEKLVEALNPKRDLLFHPLFQVKLTIQKALTLDEDARGPGGLMGLTLNPLEVDNHTAKVSLQLNLTDTEREIIGSLDYDSNLFTSVRMNSMLERFQLLLERVVIQPDTELRVLEEMLNLSNRQRNITNEEILQRVNSQNLKKSRRKPTYIPGS